jgi:hypothetical protein
MKYLCALPITGGEKGKRKEWEMKKLSRLQRTFLLGRQ